MTWPMYSPACRKAVDALLRKGGSLSAYRANPLFPSWTGPQEGSYAYRLEREIERRFKVRHAVAVNSGTAALQAAIAASLPKPRDASGEIIVSPYTFSATAAAIVLAGFTPVFADVDPYSFCISPETVKRVVTKNTRAILPVHLFGGMADVRGLQALGLPVIEDACQAVGARNGDGFSGTLGLAGCYSFNGTKNIPAGEAGCLVTNSDKVAEAARLFMNHGENFHQREVSGNGRMNELTACVAYHGLLELDERNDRRRELAWSLRKHLRLNGFWDWEDRRLGPAWFPEEGEWDTHVFYVYPFLIGHDRSKFIKRMSKHNIPVGAGYITPPLHKYPAFRKYARGHLPVVEELSSKTLCILSTLTPDRNISCSRKVAQAMRESLR